MEYYNLKLENRNNYKNSQYTDSLVMMISEYYGLNEKESLEIVKNTITTTKTPIELLRTLQKSIQKQ
jgi:hypothetical protein